MLCATGIVILRFAIVALTLLAAPALTDDTTTTATSTSSVSGKSCVNAVPLSARQQASIRILPVGDSLTSCSRVSRSFDSAQLSYRRWLWQLLTGTNSSARKVKQNGNMAYRHDEHFNTLVFPEDEHHSSSPICCNAHFSSNSSSSSSSCTPSGDMYMCTFVGTWVGCNKKLDAAFPPSATFPARHDSYFGRTASNIASAARSILSDTRPTHVLLWGGINDLLMNSASAELVVSRLLRSASTFLGNPPAIRVYVGQLLPIHRKKARIPRLKYEALEKERLRVNELLASEHFCANVTRRCSSSRESCPCSDKGGGCQVVSFPQFNATLHTYDGIHPNDDGEQYIADQWFAAVLKDLPPPRPTPTSGGADVPPSGIRDSVLSSGSVQQQNGVNLSVEPEVLDRTVLIIVFAVSVASFLMSRRRRSTGN